jgi:hypothetical protein
MGSTHFEVELLSPAARLELTNRAIAAIATSMFFTPAS